MPRAIAMFALLCLAAGHAAAQRVGPPVKGRPIDFSNIEGKYELKVIAEPTEVKVGEAITLKVAISGSGPVESEPKRRHLQLFPAAFERDFYVLPMPEADRIDRDAKSWLFVYRLKAKHDRIEAIDGLKLVIYNPDHPGTIKFVQLFADPIAIKVQAKADKPIDPELDVAATPESFYTIAPTEQIISSPESWTIGPWQFALAIALPPLLCFAGVWAIGRWFPSDARRIRQFRSSAAGRALDLLKSGASGWDVVRQYLQDRFDFAALDPTPAEAAAFLKRRGFAKSLCEMTRAFFQECDAARFATEVSAPALAEKAARLSQALEADPCARA